MQFKLAKSHRYWWPVTVRVPDPDVAGRMVEQNLKIQIDPMGREEEMVRSEKAAALKTSRELVDFEIEGALRIVKSWDGVVDANGEPVSFSEDALRQALEFAWFRSAIAKAYSESVSGN